LSREGIVAKARGLMLWGELSETNADHAIQTAFDDPDGQNIVALLEAWL
jgi:hypothetical protein